MGSVVMLSAFRTSERDKMLHKMAAPFFDLAERIEEAGRNTPDSQVWEATLAANDFIWRATADFLPRNFDEDVPEETTTTLKNIAEFMSRAGRVVLNKPKSDICAQIVSLNRNMYNQLLTMRAGP